MPLSRMIAAASLACLAACGERHAAAPGADVTAAAAAAQQNIASYAADTRATATRDRPTSPATPTTAPKRIVASESAADDAMDSVPPKEPAADTDAAAAERVVRRYYAALDAGRWDDAYRAWDDAGQASGMGAAAFAAAAAQRQSVRVARIGPAGRIDAGAGQRYVTVPVTLAGVTGGEPVRGAATLHRTAAIDGATAAQRAWHITELTPNLTDPQAPARCERRTSTRGGPVWQRDPACDPPRR